METTRQILETAHISIKDLKPIDPGLEDVFVAMVKPDEKTLTRRRPRIAALRQGRPLPAPPTMFLSESTV